MLSFAVIQANRRENGNLLLMRPATSEWYVDHFKWILFSILLIERAQNHFFRKKPDVSVKTIDIANQHHRS